MTEHPDLITEIHHGTGLITLNRPKALNALSFEVIRVLQQCLSDWAENDQIQRIFIQGTGDRAFCAGGDVRSLRDAHLRGNHTFIQEFFRQEYTLNYLVASFPKPYIALMDGVVMGGGCGISVHGSHRIVTERTILAMPETAIGYFPDIGASYFLSHCPGRIGLYLGLTGAHIKAADILYAGLADTFIPSSKIDHAQAAVMAGEPLLDVFESFQEDPGPSELENHRTEIDFSFDADTLQDLKTRVQQERDLWVENTLQALDLNSPFSLEMTFNLLKNKDIISARDSLITDYRIAWHMIEMADFYEGVRAVLVDKDNQPSWNPSSMEAVDPEQLAGCFATLGADDLVLPPS